MVNGGGGREGEEEKVKLSLSLLVLYEVRLCEDLQPETTGQLKRPRC